MNPRDVVLDAPSARPTPSTPAAFRGALGFVTTIYWLREHRPVGGSNDTWEELAQAAADEAVQTSALAGTLRSLLVRLRNSPMETLIGEEWDSLVTESESVEAELRAFAEQTLERLADEKTPDYVRERLAALVPLDREVLSLAQEVRWEIMERQADSEKPAGPAYTSAESLLAALDAD